MAEIGPLLLPPPTAFGGRGVTSAAALGRNGKSETRDDGALTQVEAAADTTNGPRAKNFRFRVVDGGRSDQLGNAELPARSQRDAAEADAATARAGTAAIGRDQTTNRAGNSSAVPAGTPVATFLAQLIAQEQLAPGLYDPPVKAADRAYRQAGAEPPLNDAETATARFRIAV